MLTRRLAGLTGLLVVALVGCGKIPDRHYVLSAETQNLGDAEARQAIAQALEKHFGTPEQPRLEGTKLVTQERLVEGSKLFRVHCLHCHGVSGDGAGPTAPFLFPRPRDYRKGIFKFTSTNYGAAPTEVDLRRTLIEGIPGTAMPSFKLLPEEDRESLLDYVILLSMRGELEQFLLAEAQFGVPDESVVEDSLDTIIARWEQAPSQVVHPREAMPSYSDELALAGRELFLTTSAQCVSCHGRDFRGRGKEDMNPDTWGNTIRPADLTLGLYRGGRRPIDIYWRIATGISGTPMPSYRNSLTDEQIWELVHFVRALPYREDFQHGPTAGAEDQVASRR